MKILDFSPFYPPHIGGLEKYNEELHEKLAEKNCQITVFTPHIPKDAELLEQKNENTKIIRYPAIEIVHNFPFPSLWKSDFWKQYKKLSTQKYDVVISTSRFFVQPIMALTYSKFKKLPRIHIEHGSSFVRHNFWISFVARIFDHTFGWLSLKTSDSIISISQPVSEFVKKLSSRKSRVIYRGMPFEKIDAIEVDSQIRKKHKNKKIITFVGRLIHGKGVIHLLESLRKINDNNIVLVIVGDGGEMNNLKKYAQEHNLENIVDFIGSVDFGKAISILKSSDVFVNPSYSEGLPTSVLEAGACKCPIIATDVGGTSEIITHKKSGIIIPPKNNQALIESLNMLLNSPQKCKFFSENARKEIESKFDWEKSVKLYLEVINFLDGCRLFFWYQKFSPRFFRKYLNV